MATALATSHDRPTIRIHAPGPRPPLAIVVGHVAAGEADEDGDLQEQQRQRGRQIEDDEDLRIVVGERGQKVVGPPEATQAADEAGRWPRRSRSTAATSGR